MKEEDDADAPSALPPPLDDMLEGGVLDFDFGDLGDSDDEGLPTGKDLSGFWSGIAARAYANPEELPQGAEPTARDGRTRRHGDLLPIHPGLVTQGLEGISTSNLHWVRLVVVFLDYLYCSAWSKAICVPMSPVLGQNQREAIRRIASQVDKLIAREEKLLSAKGAAAKLSSKRFDYNGQPVEHMRRS